MDISLIHTYYQYPFRCSLKGKVSVLLIICKWNITKILKHFLYCFLSACQKLLLETELDKPLI